jgi:hypothetical protein
VDDSSGLHGNLPAVRGEQLVSRLKALALPLYVASRLLLAGGLVVLVIMSIRAAISFTNPPPDVESYEGVAAEDTGPGNQFLFNGGLVELDMGESDTGPEELMAQFSEECAPGSVQRQDSGTGFVLSCRPKGHADEGGTEQTLPSVVWVQEDEEGKSSYMKLSPMERIALDSLIPGDGDSAGFDIEGLPRAPAMERWMSFADPTGSYRSVFYGRGSGSVESARRWFQEALPRSGWSLLREQEPGAPHLFATGHNQLVMISLTEGCEGVCASVMATPMRSTSR